MLRILLLLQVENQKELPNVKIDGKKVLGYRKAMSLDKQPKKMVVVGSGAIGSRILSYFYN